MAKKNKVEKLNAEVTYSGDGELLSDISSSEPLKPLFVCDVCGKEYKTKNGLAKHSKTCKVKEIEKIEIFENTYLTDKEIYNKMMFDGDFILKHKGTIIFDSTKDNKNIVSFEDQGLYVNKNFYTYQGFNFKYKK